MQAIILLACLASLLFFVLSLFVLILRVACGLCGVERPNFLIGSAVVFTGWFVVTVFEYLLLALTEKLYETLGYPFWEADLVCFIVALPMKMLIDSFLHLLLLRVSLGKAVEVWFAKILIEVGLLAGLAAVIAIYMLAANG